MIAVDKGLLLSFAGVSIDSDQMFANLIEIKEAPRQARYRFVQHGNASLLN
jgi:hypothetical protein